MKILSIQISRLPLRHRETKFESIQDLAFKVIFPPFPPCNLVHRFPHIIVVIITTGTLSIFHSCALIQVI